MKKFQAIWKPVRFAAFGSAMLMLVTLSAGCGKGNAASTPSSKASPGTSAPESTSSEREVRDLDGYTFTYLSMFGGDTIFEPEQGKSDMDDAYYERNQKLMKNWNFNIKTIQKSLDVIDDYIIGSALAGDNPADIIQTDYSHMLNYRDADALRPFSDMKNIDLGNTKKWKQAMTKACTNKGKVYGIHTGVTPGIVMFYNATLLKEKNIDSPADLYKQDKWTWAELKRLLTQATIDDNGDGKPEIYGMAYSRWSTLNFEMPMSYTNGKNLIDVPDGADPVFNGTSTNVLESLGYIKDLFDAKVIDPKSDLTAESSRDAFMTRKCAFIPQQVNWWGYLLDMKDDYGFVPLPKGPQATEYTSVAPQLVMYVTTIACPDADKASLVLDLLTERPDPTGDPVIDDPMNYMKTKLVRDDTTLEVYLDLEDKTIPCLPMSAPSFAWSCWLPAVDEVLADKKTPKAAMESIEEASLIYLKEAFNKEA